MKKIQLTPVALALLISASAAVAMQDSYNQAVESGKGSAWSYIKDWVTGTPTATQVPATTRNAQGSLPIHLAAKNGELITIGLILGKEDTASIRFMLEAKDENGKTAAQLAQENGHPWVAMMLEQAVKNLTK